VQQLAKPKEHVCFHRNICPSISSLSVGALLYIYAAKNGIEVPTDLVTGNQEPIYFS
jgi:hypothetical protein